MTRTQLAGPTVFATNPNADLYGASRMFLESVQGMAALGWRVVVSTSQPSGPLLEAVRAAGCEERSVPSPVLRKTYLNLRGILRLLGLTLRSIPAEVRLLREVRPDVIYANTVIQPLWLVLGRCLGIPVVCHVHEAEASASRPVRKALALPMLLARRLILNSRFSKKVLLDALPSVEGRSVVIDNGVTGPPHVDPPRLELDGTVRMLYVGRLSDRKGTVDAIEAVALLVRRGVDSRLDIVGSALPGTEAVEDALRQQVAAARLGDRVRFLGFQPTVWRCLADCDVLLVPSRTHESFGNTAIEALLAARPVIATRTGGLVEATEGFDAALTVSPSAPDEIADAVQHVVDHWSEFRAHALVDARNAAIRHSPATYRSAVAGVVAETVQTSCA
jgi:glycosyltransferase involved in cell wall biosynthesis